MAVVPHMHVSPHMPAPAMQGTKSKKNGKKMESRVKNASLTDSVDQSRVPPVAPVATGQTLSAEFLPAPTSVPAAPATSANAKGKTAPFSRETANVEPSSAELVIHETEAANSSSFLLWDWAETALGPRFSCHAQPRGSRHHPQRCSRYQ